MFRSKNHPQGATLSLLKSLLKTSCISPVSLIIYLQNSANVNTLDIITILLTIYLINIIYITDMPQNQDYITKAISN